MSYPTYLPAGLERIVEDIADERARQDRKFPPASPTSIMPNGDDMARVAVLCEETGEAARAAIELRFFDQLAADAVPETVDNARRSKLIEALRGELVQVAAVAVAWLQAIDQEGGCPLTPETVLCWSMVGLAVAVSAGAVAHAILRVYVDGLRARIILLEEQLDRVAKKVPGGKWSIGTGPAAVSPLAPIVPDSWPPSDLQQRGGQA